MDIFKICQIEITSLILKLEITDKQGPEQTDETKSKSCVTSEYDEESKVTSARAKEWRLFPSANMLDYKKFAVFKIQVQFIWK